MLHPNPYLRSHLPTSMTRPWYTPFPILIEHEEPLDGVLPPSSWLRLTIDVLSSSDQYTRTKYSGYLDIWVICKSQDHRSTCIPVILAFSWSYSDVCASVPVFLCVVLRVIVLRLAPSGAVDRVSLTLQMRLVLLPLRRRNRRLLRLTRVLLRLSVRGGDTAGSCSCFVDRCSALSEQRASLYTEA